MKVKPKKEFFKFSENGASWLDNWHQSKSVNCTELTNVWGLFTLTHSYEVSLNPYWGWQSKLTQRPDGSLILQLTNIAPWGEEGRAVRMIFSLIKT